MPKWLSTSLLGVICGLTVFMIVTFFANLGQGVTIGVTVADIVCIVVLLVFDKDKKKTSAAEEVEEDASAKEEAEEHVGYNPDEEEKRHTFTMDGEETEQNDEE